MNTPFDEEAFVKRGEDWLASMLEKLKMTPVSVHANNWNEGAFNSTKGMAGVVFNEFSRAMLYVDSVGFYLAN